MQKTKSIKKKTSLNLHLTSTILTFMCVAAQDAAAAAAAVVQTIFFLFVFRLQIES